MSEQRYAYKQTEHRYIALVPGTPTYDAYFAGVRDGKEE